MPTAEDVEREMNADMDIQDILDWYALSVRRDRLQRTATGRLVWIVPLVGNTPSRAAVDVGTVLVRAKECVHILGPDHSLHAPACAFIEALDSLVQSLPA